MRDPEVSPQHRAHGAANLTDREAATDWGGATCASHKNGGKVDWSKGDAFYFGLKPVNHPVCFCQRHNGASLKTATCHRSSQPRFDLRPCWAYAPPRPLVHYHDTPSYDDPSK